jgi:rhodanese-related sulfurtransferase
MMKSSQRKQKKQPLYPVIVLTGLLLVTLLAGGFILAQGQPGSTTAQKTGEISVAVAAARYDEGVFVLDVREPWEWQEVHIPGATLIPLAELGSRLNELPQDEEIVVVCRSGNRSATARDILLQAGFENVTSMAGGMLQWQAAGYDTTAGN